jgi:uncharacterized OB-fold protein
MKCPQCGQDNPPQAKFCQECATPLAARCTQCGTQLPPNAKFCFECATPVAAADARRAGKLHSHAPRRTHPHLARSDAIPAGIYPDERAAATGEEWEEDQQ